MPTARYIARDRNCALLKAAVPLALDVNIPTGFWHFIQGCVTNVPLALHGGEIRPEATVSYDIASKTRTPAQLPLLRSMNVK